jgi:hypothetical protein
LLTSKTAAQSTGPFDNATSPTTCQKLTFIKW